MTIRPADLLTADHLKAYNKLRKLLDQIWGRAEQTGDVPLDQRISLSIQKLPRKGFVPCIHVDREDNVAFRRAKEILKDYPFVRKRFGGGEAQAAYPDDNVKLHKHATSGQLLPGSAVSHGRFPFGTLGCIVEIEIKNAKVKCAISAAHVLNLTRSSEIGDDIYCPGRGSTPRLSKSDVFGRLKDSVPLLPLNPDIRISSNERVSIDIDVALVEITDNADRRSPVETRVPHPRDPRNKTMKLKGPFPESRLPDLLGSEVYMFGAVSGFSRGTLTDICTTERILRLPNRQNYLYHDLLAVAPKRGKTFAQSGDSGAAVYTRSGLLVGFLVGSDQDVSFVCIGERAVDYFKGRVI